MNPQQEAVALYRYFESRGKRLSARAIGRILRQEMGLRFTEAELRTWIAPFSVASPTQSRRSFREETTQSRRNLDAASREKEVSLVSNLEPSTLTSLSLGDTHNNAREEVKQPVSRLPRQPKLGLDKAETIAASDLCRALWTAAGGFTGITFTAWKQRNMRDARSMVQAGVDAAALVEAASALHDFRGYWPSRIAWVQNYMAQQGAKSIDNPEDPPVVWLHGGVADA